MSGVAGRATRWPASSVGAFEDHLAREILQSERMRLAILAGIFALLMVLFPLFALVFREDYLRNFRSVGMIGYALGVAAALVAYELLMRGVLGRQLAAGRTPSPLLRFWNALIETSVPTVLMLVLGQYADAVLVLQGPAAFLYAVFIVLSTLRLDIRLSVFTGLVAAAEFVALSFLVAPAATDHATPAVLIAPGFVLMKGVMLLLAGVAAGFVAAQLRRRIVKAFYASEERQRIVNAFGQQVSPEVVEELLRQGPEIPSRRGFVCVMFMDIRDFTRLVEHRSPEEIVAIQNAVFGAAVEVVNRHHGIINQFLGDGFMATFGAPLATGEDCRNAVAAARELVARVKALADAGRIPAAAVGIGLHAGEAVSGNVGPALRKQYSITGNVVILASRIEQLNKDYGSQLLISGEVLQASGDQGAGAVPLGPVRVKGRDNPIELYRLA
ncbi:MAG: adenylate/guanylate cyclase domain-containing protein [Betaproteobacteria bacterium]|nr:MAG: adenylate/guanylate cyclase domain-containing protein [Betaproteobacteria bacterium]